MKTDSVVLKPTHTRYWIIVFAVTLSIISYIDRVCISQASPYIIKDLGLTVVQMGWVFAAFQWAYALFEIPTGWLGDRIGARKVLLRVVLWWSFFTAATGWAGGLVSLIAIRAMFGAGEAGCFPNLTKSFTTWLSSAERVRAQGFMWLSARWGGAFTPMLVVMVLDYMSWRRAFALFAGLGIVWAIFFYRWYRDNPRDHPRVNSAELALMPKAEQFQLGQEPIPWKKFFRSRTVWMLWAQYFIFSYPWVFYITWLPRYIREGRGVETHWGAVLAGLPLFLGGIGSIACGFLLPRVAIWLGDTIKARRLMACIGYGGASLLWIVSIQCSNPVTAMLALGMASLFGDLALPTSWAACMDVGGKYAGTLSGSMNMMGNIGAAVGATAVAYIFEATGQNWAANFYVSAVVYLFGIVCWLFLDPVTPLEEESRA